MGAGRGRPRRSRRCAGETEGERSARFEADALPYLDQLYGTTLLLDYVLGVPRGWAKAVGWVVGTTFVYFMNAKWTFNSKTSAKATVAVAILYLSTFAVQNILYKVVPMPLHSFELPKFVVDTISFVIAQGVATVTNFVMQRAFIFKQR